MKQSFRGPRVRHDQADKVLLGGSQLTRTFRTITTTGVQAAAATAIVYGDGTTGTSVQPNTCSSWSDLAASWQEYRVKSIAIKVFGQLYNPTAAAAATAIPMQVYTFHDRTGEITEANAAAASLAQLVDQEGFKYTTLFPFYGDRFLMNRIKARDPEDYLWIPTQSATVDRYRLVLVFPLTVVANNCTIISEWVVEFKGRANSGLVELQSKHVKGCRCGHCLSK